ncbi:MAG: toll/interleukin-1 receptor domain-containing protein [Flavobacteriales bacterium]
MSKEPELTLKDEEIIRREATTFAEQELQDLDTHSVARAFQKVKIRLADFYAGPAKSIFLDQLTKDVSQALNAHRDQAHGGEPKPDCPVEGAAEVVLFYLRQEIGTLPIVAHQKYHTADAPRTNVFISYSHRDKDVLTEVQRHFKPLKAGIELWDDERIKGGDKWKDEIRKAIKNTKVAIPLVSTDFLGSEFIASEELPPLLAAAEKEGAVILPLILKPCLFDEFPDLNQYQALNPPSKPLSSMDLNEREELFVNMVRQTKRILDGQA